VTVLREEEVDPRLRANSYGYGLTKMVSYWHAPFERFLHIDSDAVCWGNILTGVPWQEFDLVYNEPHEIITPFIQCSQYFDPDKVFPDLPAFPWLGQPFFNSGCFTARKGIFDLDEYLDLLNFQKRREGAFLCGDQGILNFMAFRRIADGRIRARAWPFQAVVPVIPPEELGRRFRVDGAGPVIRDDDRRLIHWAGLKPYLTRGASFPGPMTYYRLEHLRRCKSRRIHLGKLGLMLEEVEAKIAGRYGGSFRKALLSKGRWLWRRLRQKRN
jgi:hypothetical protein